MAYGKKKSSGGIGGIYRGPHYSPGKNPMDAYRQPSHGEDEYHRKLKNAIEKNELRGPEHFFSKEPHYKTNFPIEVSNSRFSEPNMKEFADSVLKQVLEEIHQEKTEITTELYKEIKENTTDVTGAFEKILNDTDDETTILDFTKKMLNPDSEFDNKINELNSKLDDVDHRTNEDVVDTGTIIQDIGEVHQEFSRRKNHYDSEVGY
ncbi:MAG: hypothetical protein WD717_06415 [Nitrosarchaeum sp.]